MLAQALIGIKRDGGTLSPSQIQSFVQGLVDERWSEGQVAAMAMAILLKGMTGMAIGGMGNVYGAMLGGLLVGVLETLAVSYLSSAYQDVIVFAALIGVLMFKPAGLFGVQIRDRA